MDDVRRASSARRLQRAWRRTFPTVPLLAVVTAAGFLAAFDPTDPRHRVTGPCMWHALTGVNGPTCGGTRAFYYLIHADLIDAIRCYAPLVIAAPLLAYWWLAWALNAWFGLRLPLLRPRRRLITIVVVTSLVFTTVLRNLPVPGLSWFDIPNATQRMI